MTTLHSNWKPAYEPPREGHSVLLMCAHYYVVGYWKDEDETYHNETNLAPVVPLAWCELPELRGECE